MADDNIVLEHLRAIRATQDRHTQEFLEVKQRLGFLERQYASISRRVDSIDARMDRIEKRRDLVEA